MTNHCPTILMSSCKNYFNYNWLYVCIVITVTACIRDNDLHQVVDGYKPIYISYDSLLHFKQSDPRTFSNTGKISYYNKYLFMVEHLQGVHIINLSDTTNPERISFLEIPGVQDITIKDQILYTDNGPHLLVIDITDLNHVVLLKRNLFVFQQTDAKHPPVRFGWFECYNPNAGWVLDWQTTTLTDPKCSL